MEKLAGIAARIAASKELVFDSRRDQDVFITMVRENRNVKVYKRERDGKAVVEILALNEDVFRLQLTESTSQSTI